MELLMGKWILYELLKKHSEYWKAEEKIIGEVQLSVNKQKLSGKADNHGFQSMYTLKSKVGDIGITSLLESKKGWSQGTAIVLVLGGTLMDCRNMRFRTPMLTLIPERNLLSWYFYPSETPKTKTKQIDSKSGKKAPKTSATPQVQSARTKTLLSTICYVLVLFVDLCYFLCAFVFCFLFVISFTLGEKNLISFW